ncbi:hypothetical protein HU200_051684 [Digitaria exilis]|uniref:No apical meristem-associated C-terminal domain-containing protein n=1 Tax=Digitaria exilis TaxID=1010633 RepID=A0A835E6R3_9POAL|nr:hypothetical protein HU200_051684 [Digitaria exilis]
MNISSDPIIGNEQPTGTYWERIAQDFHENKEGKFESKRTPNSLEHRCGLIVKECMKFQAFYEEVEHRHPSGVPYQEHMLQAQARYARQAKGKACQFIHCWLQIRHSEKFAKAREQANLPVQSNPTHDQAKGLQDSGQGEDSSIPTAKKARPPGRKKSKDKLKRDEEDDDYKILMKNLMVMKTE